MPSREDRQRHNILLIMADDLGFADIGCFGSEIPTPNLDKLAARGLRLTRFYTSFLCSPTRAMLMSGMDNHRAGLGSMAELMGDNQVGLDGYEGYLNNRVLSMAELLRDAGYHTYMAGKWHLGTEVDQDPRARGFERSFAMLGGAASHFNDRAGPNLFRQMSPYSEDGQRIYDLPDDFYSSDYFTDRILEYIHSNAGDEQPFFAYLPFTAPHWPIQARQRYLDKFRGAYDEGYEVIRERRFERMKEMGVVSANAKLPRLDEKIPAWDSLSPEERRTDARIMEIYAGMVNNMDHNIGRVLNYLDRNGLGDNTLVFFCSDNGADGFMKLTRFPQFEKWIESFDNSPENLGRRGSFPVYSAGWAQAGEAPWRLFKGFTTEGGIRSPAIAALPGCGDPGGMSDATVHISDLLPTALDLAGHAHPGSRYHGREILEPTGRSAVSLLRGESASIRGSDDTLGFETIGRISVVKGDWKIVRLPKPLGAGEWELFNLVDDPGEQDDLAASEPERLTEMIAAWDDYSRENNVVLPESLRMRE